MSTYTGGLLKGKVCLVTGASRGIGAAIAGLLAMQGAQVIVNYCHSEDSAMKIVEQITASKGKAIAVKADVSNAAEVNNMFDYIEQQLGPVDLLVNNAGVSLKTLVTETSENDWDRVLGVNLKGVFLCCRRALPHMIRKRYGRIVNIASVWGLKGASCESVYAASKGGVVIFTKSLAKEVGISGVNVNALAPGPIYTEMLAEELDNEELCSLSREIPAGRLGTTEDVAQACLYLLSDQAAYVNGQIISIDGGWTV